MVAGMNLIPKTFHSSISWFGIKRLASKTLETSKMHNNEKQLHVSFHVSWCKRLNSTCPIHKPCPKDSICVLKHAVLQADNYEL